MKTMYSKNRGILPICILLLFFFTSCEKDLYEDAISTQPEATSQKISVNQLLSEINNPMLKKYVRNGLLHGTALSSSRTTGEDYLNFVKIIKENGYTTYSLLINNYSEGKPYMEYFIITKKMV